jgi:osmotically inducible protein OsmC
MLMEEVFYHAQVKATVGRDIRTVSSDGALDLKVKRPRKLGATNGRGTNPEQLFAAAYAASFLGNMMLVAVRDGIEFPKCAEVEAGVGVGPAQQAYGIEVELRIRLPGIPRAEADLLVEKSHALCPYSNATRGNVAVRLVFA